MLPIALPLDPMLARAVDALPRGPQAAWSYEPKWDGFRCIAARDGDTVTLWSRHRKDLTRSFPEIAEACRRLMPERAVVDGELVVRSGEPGRQRLDWEALSLRLHPSDKRTRALAEATPAEMVCFDLLALADLDLTVLPQRERRAALVALFEGVPHQDRLHITRATGDVAEAERWFADFEGAGLDGVVAKAAADPYRPGQRAMLKVKHARTADAVVIGYGRSRTGAGVGSLHLGLYDDGELIPVGGIGAWSDAARAHLAAALEPLVLSGEEADAAPRPAQVTRAGVREFVPLRPDLVAEVAYDQLEGRRFRHAVQFVRWRPDRDPATCQLAQLERAPSYDLDAVLRP